MKYLGSTPTGFISTLLLAISLISFPCSAITESSDVKISGITVSYLSAGKDDLAIKDLVVNSGNNELVKSLSKQYFRFEQPLVIEYGSSEGPLYDPSIHTIQIPYHFIADSLAYFSANNYLEEYGKTVEDAAMDTLLHTLLHEVGHAYIVDQDIAILGKEEDAVDHFAAVVMLNFIDGGDEALISAADMFAFESENRPEYYDYGEYIDDHSFDLQRYFSSLCMVYGFAPERYTKLLNQIEKEYRVERKSFCIDNFEILNQNWQRYFSH